MQSPPSALPRPPQRLHCSNHYFLVLQEKHTFANSSPFSWMLPGSSFSTFAAFKVRRLRRSRRGTWRCMYHECPSRFSLVPPTLPPFLPFSFSPSIPPSHPPFLSSSLHSALYLLYCTFSTDRHRRAETTAMYKKSWCFDIVKCS